MTFGPLRDQRPRSRADMNGIKFDGLRPAGNMMRFYQHSLGTYIARPWIKSRRRLRPLRRRPLEAEAGQIKGKPNVCVAPRAAR